jgi:hypothetical protein
VDYCSDLVDENSIYAVLHRECHQLFPDEMFADLFTTRGRNSVPPMIVAVVMVLQRVEGLSDREAVQRFAFDARWKYAAGGLSFDYPSFVHSVLVETRARLARSDHPDRIFEATLTAAKSAGLVGRKRVLDSTPLYDAVATMDTVTLIRSGIRGVLQAAGADLAEKLRGLLGRADDYVDAGKPTCDWDDASARNQLVDELAKDASRLLTELEGRPVDTPVGRAVELLATVVGQDLQTDEHGVFHIVRGVAKDRVISTVDPQARHGRKTSALGFDGYKGHIAVDPESEIITATTTTAGNAGDAGSVDTLLAGDLPTDTADADADADADDTVDSQDSQDDQDDQDDQDGRVGDEVEERFRVYGDAAYGSGEVLAGLEAAGVENFAKVQPPSGKGGLFSKDRFDIDQPAGTVTCPSGQVAPIRPSAGGGGTAKFGGACADCPLASECTKSVRGRTIKFGPHEDELNRARQQQQDPEWQEEYRATRPKVERKIGHMMRRKHGGRHARMRGLQKIGADLKLLAAATNLARLGKLGYRGGSGGTDWLVTT